MTVDQKIYIKIAKKIKKQLKKKGQANVFWLQYYEKQSLYLINVHDNKISIEVVQGKSSVRVAPSDPLYSFLTLRPGGILRLGSAVQLKLLNGNEAGTMSALTTLDSENVTFWGAFIYGTNGGKDFGQLASLMLFGNPLQNTSDCKFHFLNMKKRPRRIIGFIDLDEDEKSAEPISPPTSKTPSRPPPQETITEEEVKSAELAVDPFEIVEMDPFDDGRVKKLEDEISSLHAAAVKSSERESALQDQLKKMRLERDQLQTDFSIRQEALKQTEERLKQKEERLKSTEERLNAKTSECECLLRSMNQLQEEIEKQNQALTDIQFEREQGEEKAKGLQKLMNNLKRDPKLIKELTKENEKLTKEISEQKIQNEKLQLQVDSLKERSGKLEESLELVTIESANYEGMFKQQLQENDGMTQRLDNVNSLYAGSQSRLKSLEVELEAIKEDSKAEKKTMIEKHTKQLNEIIEENKKSLEKTAANFQLEKEIIVRRQTQLLEDMKVNDAEKSKIIQNLTSDRNALQSTVDSIRKEMLKLAKMAKQEGLQKEVDFLKRELAEKREQIETLKNNITIQQKVNPKEEKRKSKSMVPTLPISLKKSSNLEEVQSHYKQIIANLTSTISDKEDTIRMMSESHHALAARLLEVEGKMSEASSI